MDTIPGTAQSVTAYAISGDRDKLLQVGMNDYLAKPVQLQELSRKLARLAKQDTPAK